MCYLCDEQDARAEAAWAAGVSEVKQVPASRTLTRETLLAGRPCYEYRERFTERFPESVEVTVELAVSQSSDWDWYWAAETLLTYAGYRAFNLADNEANRAHSTTMRPYRDALSATRTKCNDVYGHEMENGITLGLGYYQRAERARELASEAREVEDVAYQAVWEVASKRLQRARAKAWAEIFISETDEQLFAEKGEPSTWHSEYNDDYDDYDDEPCGGGSCG